MVRSSCAVLGLVALVTLAAGCAGERTAACVPDDVYRDAVSASPLRVPDDLSVPDESEALRLPPGGAVQQQRSPDRCLEHPPDFFEEQLDS